MSSNKESISSFLHDLVINSPLQNSESTKHEIKQANPGADSHAIAQMSKLQPQGLKDYMKEYKSMITYIRDNTDAARAPMREGGKAVFQPSLITKQDALAYLEHKAETACKDVEEGKGLHQERMQNLISVVEKIPAFMVGRDDRFAAIAENWKGLHDDLQAFRSSAMVKEIASTPKVTRAYNNPQAVIAAITSDRARFIASMQDRLGLRVDNARCFNINANGTISFFSKGHMPHNNYEIPRDLYDKAVELNGGNIGKCEIMPYRTYLNNLEAACKRVGETYSGSHSLRHGFAKRLYHELLADGKSEKAAKAQVSEALFHRRLDIVDCYLR